MTLGTTEDTRPRQRRSAVRGALGYALCQAGTAAVLLGLHPAITVPWLSNLMLIIAVVDLVVIVPVFVVLRQRLSEIKGGELDAARKY